MSEYTLDVIPLTEGLNFNTATSLAVPGSLRDCLNYEFVDGAGLKRIDGMRVYDGNMRNKTDKVFFLVYTGSAVVDNSVFSFSPWLYLESDDNPHNVPFGFVAWNDETLPFISNLADTTTIIPFVRLDCPSYADPAFSSGTIKVLNSAALSLLSSDTSILTLESLSDARKAAVFGTSTVTSVDENTLLRYSQNVSYVSCRSSSSSQTTNHNWAEKIDNTTFCIADAFKIQGTAEMQVYPGDYVYIIPGGASFPLLVLKSELTAGTWASGDVTLHVAALRTTLEAEPTYRDFESQFTLEPGNDVYLYRYSSTPAVSAASVIINETGPLISRQADIACMYRADNEIGALTSDSVFTIAEPVTEGTLYDLTSHAVAATSGGAEAMLLISSGAVKTVVPTKPSTDYTTAPNFTIAASGGTSATTPVASTTSTITRADWHFVHTGWVVPFREGSRKYGYFNKIDRYKDKDTNTYSASSSVTGLEATNTIGFVDRALAPAFDPQQSQMGTRRTRWRNTGIWKTNGGLDLADDNVETTLGSDDDTTYAVQTITDNLADLNTTATRCLILNGFTGSSSLATIEEGSSVKGIKVSVKMDSNGTVNIPDDVEIRAFAVLGKAGHNFNGDLMVTKQYGQPIELMNGTSNLRDTFDNVTVSDVTFTAGGTDALFGAGSIPLEELQDPNFCIGIYFTCNTALMVTPMQIRVDHVFMDVSYELPAVRLYFKSNSTSHSGSDAVTIHGDVVDYAISGGSLEAGDATGYLTICNVRTTVADNSVGAGLTLADSAVPYYTIKANMDIYQDVATTVKVGETSGEMVFNGFDSYKTIKEEGSRYTSIKANFFANDEYDAHYICSGAGRAGIWDGKYWSRIYAINPKQENSDILDKPRHAGENSFHLFLGYKSGSALFSAPGDPSNFSAFDGAGEIGIGDKIHGFNRLQGNAFGVFCEESVHAITGSDVGNFTKQVLVPNEGALEYSVANFGGRVIYTSKTGITTLDQSEKYGNFLGRRLSFDINPWLVPRISGGAGLFTSISDFNPVFESGNGFVCAYAVPHKNQYRVWFKDGLQLWMTLVADDAPKFTFVQYFTSDVGGSDLRATPLIPMYVSSRLNETDSNSTLLCPDREFAITDPARIAYPGQMQTGIYCLDVGDCFDGGVSSDLNPFMNRAFRQAIPHYALINYQYLKNPFTSKTLRKVRIEGQTRGCAPLTIYCEDGYKESAQEVRTTGTNISLPKVPLDELKLSFKPESTLANVAATGRVLSILLVGEGLTNDPYFTTTGTSSLTSTRTTVPNPSHYLQAMLVQFSDEGTQDA